ncbi:hypothetical protein GCM10027610_114900 [Dactylosporangium cerinum]
MGSIDDIADRYVEQWAPLDPIGATFVGVAGHDDRLTDLSPDGFAALADLDRHTLAALAAETPATETERVAKEAMQERLGLALERFEAGDMTSDINVISSPLHGVRSSFDLMPTEGEEAATNIKDRLRAVPVRAGAVAAFAAARRPAGARGAGPADHRGRQAVRGLGRPRG